MNIGSSMEFDLHELTASDRRSELQQLLVGMGRLIETLQTNLTGNCLFVTSSFYLQERISNGYYIAQNFGGLKLWQNHSAHVFGKYNFVAN